MLKSLFFIGLVIFLLGGVSFLGLSVPTIGGYISQLFSFIPLQQQYSAILFIVIGLILMGLSFHSKMGKYFKYY